MYPNARIHVGWAWECLGADWLTRSLRLQGRETFFATGMDEHSLNVQRAAEARNLTPKVYCDEMASAIEKTLREMGMSYDRFIRTSDADHERVVQHLVQKAFDKGDLYKAKYEGWYCEGCEAFYTEKDLKSGNCPEHGTKPKWLVEENYFFKLSKYQKALEDLFAARPDFLMPESRRSEIVNFIKAGLKDFSVSRSTFTWGIPLPFDQGTVVYVWFDALINYLTAAGYEFKIKNPGSKEALEFDRRWPAKLHIVGKDIARFHCVFWPAMLMSLDIPLPEQVFAHGWLSFKGERLSKSTGNVVTPEEVMALGGADPFRYYLLADNHFAGDGNFAWEAFVLKSNADLSNSWGNLVNRTISMTRKYFPEEELAPTGAGSEELKQSFAMRLRSELEAATGAVDPSTYIAACNARVRELNLFIDQTKPWALAKDSTPEGREKLRQVMLDLLEGIRWTATAMLSVLPFGMPDVFRQIGVPAPKEQGALQALAWRQYAFRPVEPKPLYPRLELAKE